MSLLLIILIILIIVAIIPGIGGSSRGWGIYGWSPLAIIVVIILIL